MDQDMKNSSYKVCRSQNEGWEEMSLSSLHAPWRVLNEQKEQFNLEISAGKV